MTIADEMNTLRLRRLKIMDDHHRAQEKLRRKMLDLLQQVDDEIREVGDRSPSLPCLVRGTPGPSLTVYHSADAPCGRVHDRRNFWEMPEVDAMDASPHTYLERCTACSWHHAASIHGKRLLNA
ncbi:hypothetical protein HUT16_15940 [Kitasatospora sp. NA04385]|uniref:hypothetical protein n=1 Tax=Kitasatospora sp. NA04385 TaxID=2742135 RepID=UPI0015914DC5|nr:hypothetical protein [Kitasatospora sp. NA04385]QKW20358.1 hypothetical protein HUT16_15940 [Kitasatospora sp. NA04385]